MPNTPDWGGWGGRFDLGKKAGIRSMDWVSKSGLDETKYDPYLMLGSAAARLPPSVCGNKRYSMTLPHGCNGLYILL